MEKFVFEALDKKLTFEEKNNNLSIEFFSLEEDNTFIIPISNIEIYNIFDDKLSRLSANQSLFGEDIKEIYIYDEDSFGTSMVSIHVLKECVEFNFSSEFYTKINIRFDNDNKDSMLIKELFDSLKEIDTDYYQTFIDESMSEGKEYRVEIK